MKQQFAAKHPWTILAAGAAIQVLTGLPAAWGVFQQPVMEEYGLSEQGAGYAFGILIAAFGVGCVIGGFLQDRHGPRCAGLWGTALLCGGFFAAGLLPPGSAEAFFLAFSIPAGLGTAFLYPSIQSCAQKWYADRKGLATGVIGGWSVQAMAVWPHSLTRSISWSMRQAPSSRLYSVWMCRWTKSLPKWLFSLISLKALPPVLFPRAAAGRLPTLPVFSSGAKGRICSPPGQSSRTTR